MSTEKKRTQARQLVSCHFELIPLWAGKENTYKVPVEKWQTTPPIKSQFDPRLEKYEHFGWLIPATLCVVDVDYEHKVTPEQRAALAETDAVAYSASGKKHYLFSIDPVEADSLPRQWGGGELLVGGKHFAKVVGGKCSQSIEFQQWWDFPPPFLPDVFKAKPQARLTPGAGAENQPVAAVEKPLVVTADITAPAEEGSRNIKLTSYVGALHKRGTPWLEMVEKAQELNASYSPPLDDEEVLAICRSVARYPAGTPQPEFPASSRPADNSTGQTGRAGSVEFLSASEVQAGDFPQPQMWLDCWGPEQAVMLHGPSGSGKSLFMLDRLLRMRQVKTLVIDAEMPMSTIKKRLGRVQAPNLYWLQKEYIHEWGNLDLSSWSHVVLDTKAALYSHAESENSMEHWAPLNKWLRHWCDQGVCVSLLHHSNADASKARGSTNAITAMDSELSIRGFEVGNTKYWTVKQQKDRHGLLLPQRWFTLHQAEAQNMVFGEVENPEI